MEEPQPTVTHYALLIGICFTPKARRHEWPPLRGCVQDVQSIREKLVESAPEAELHTLSASLAEPDSPYPAETSNLPTHGNIMSCLRDIASRASQGDFVYIHFTGHGTVIDPRSPYSHCPTGELALVVLEGDHGAEIRYLRSSELAYGLMIMVRKGLKVTLVLDCCASGGVRRDHRDPSDRYLPYDLDVDLAYPPIPGQSLGPEEKAVQPVFRGACLLPNWLANPEGYTILTACGPTESAKELRLDGQYYGVLSYFLVRTFNKIGRVGGKLQHIYAHLCARFREKKVQHTPMLYGNKALHFFESDGGEGDAAPIPIVQRDGILELHAGEAQGVCNGDRFALYSIGSSLRRWGTTGDPVVFEVAQTRALTSEVRPLDPTFLPFASGMTATACTCLSLRKYCIGLDVSFAGVEGWQKEIGERPSLDVRFIDSGSSKDSFSFLVILSEDSYKIYDDTNQEIQNIALFCELNHDLDHMLEVLEHLAKFKLVQSLTNMSLSDPQHPFADSFDVHLIDTSGNVVRPGCLRQGPYHQECTHPECVVKTQDGDVVELVVRNNEKRGGPNLYVHFYNMGSLWEIENLVGDYEVVSPGYTGRRDNLVGEWSMEVEMMVPQEIRENGGKICHDVLKVFLTAQPTSFLSLEQPELSELGRRLKENRRRGEDLFVSSANWAAFNFRVATTVR